MIDVPVVPVVPEVPVVPVVRPGTVLVVGDETVGIVGITVAAPT
jgi:hypothetical protein